MTRPIKMYFLEHVRTGDLKCVVAGRPPKRKGWKVTHFRFAGWNLPYSTWEEKAELEKLLQSAFGAGASYGRNNFN